MSGLVDWIAKNGAAILRIVVLLGLGVPLIGFLSRLVARASKKRFTEQSVMLLQKGLTYSLFALLLIMILREMGFKLTALLGAAGIAGVAIGFAAQTSLSNLISGIFLISEKPFQVGDVVDIGGTLGIVNSIDLLSVKLRTFDNKFIRIPNEHLVKTQFTNVTRFPIRRFDIEVGVAYKEDIGRVMEILADVADKNPHSLDEPAPLILFKGFGDSSLDLLLGVWFEKSDMLNLRQTILREIKERFDAEGIEIPFPHRTLYAGSAAEPFPVRVISGDGAELGDGAPDPVDGKGAPPT